MKKTTTLLIAIALMAWAFPAVGQSTLEGKLCQFHNIDKTVRARLGVGDDTQYQINSFKAFWPIMLNGKQCPKLQEALASWLASDKEIKQLDDVIEYALYTDNEGVSFKESGTPYQILDKFENVEGSISSYSSTTELKSLGKRFAIFHQVFNMYFAGAAHGAYAHNYITYDTERDKIVTLDDVLIDPELIRPYILMSINLKFGYTEEDLFLPEDKIPPIPSQFYFEDGILHLVYQVYEIASYAQGSLEVPIFYPNDPSAPEYLTPYGKQVMQESVEDDLY